MKYELEKRLHEIIRDLPEAMLAEVAITKGIITTEEALKTIVEAMQESKNR